ncbi:hypothetical protein LA080_006080 [Diaporthe eres]|jgi:hypothetical protein|nr:hypothetical protein LA080_006080 [Diaporthe eres]
MRRIVVHTGRCNSSTIALSALLVSLATFALAIFNARREIHALVRPTEAARNRAQSERANNGGLEQARLQEKLGPSETSILRPKEPSGMI